MNYAELHRAYFTFELINNKRLEYNEVRCSPAVELAEVRRTGASFLGGVYYCGSALITLQRFQKTLPVLAFRSALHNVCSCIQIYYFYSVAPLIYPRNG